MSPTTPSKSSSRGSPSTITPVAANAASITAGGRLLTADARPPPFVHHVRRLAREARLLWRCALDDTQTNGRDRIGTSLADQRCDRDATGDTGRDVEARRMRDADLNRAYAPFVELIRARGIAITRSRPEEPNVS